MAKSSVFTLFTDEPIAVEYVYLTYIVQWFALSWIEGLLLIRKRSTMNTFCDTLILPRIAPSCQLLVSAYTIFMNLRLIRIVVAV